MAESGSSSAQEYSSETNTFARTVGATASPRKPLASTTSSRKLAAVPMTIPTWNRYAGHATERKPQQREHDEES